MLKWTKIAGVAMLAVTAAPAKADLCQQSIAALVQTMRDMEEIRDRVIDLKQQPWRPNSRDYMLDVKWTLAGALEYDISTHLMACDLLDRMDRETRMVYDNVQERWRQEREDREERWQEGYEEWRRGDWPPD